MIVTTPVGFSGAFNVDGVGPTQLIAAAHATLTLQHIDCSGGPAWVNGGVHYDLEPVPEPATLVIVRTTGVLPDWTAHRGDVRCGGRPHGESSTEGGRTAGV
jgi:hypothetical protein